VRFFEPGGDHGAAGVGPPVLYYDGGDGRLLGDLQPWKGTAADIFVQAQFPLHSGRILGLPGRILVSAMGLITAALSVTGIVIWWKKRAARQRRKTRTGTHIVDAFLPARRHPYPWFRSVLGSPRRSASSGELEVSPPKSEPRV
jgi:hypothetical protein